MLINQSKVRCRLADLRRSLRTDEKGCRKRSHLDEGNNRFHVMYSAKRSHLGHFVKYPEPRESRLCALPDATY